MKKSLEKLHSKKWQRFRELHHEELQNNTLNWIK